MEKLGDSKPTKLLNANLEIKIEKMKGEEDKKRIITERTGREETI